jgi:hypothetical protein
VQEQEVPKSSLGDLTIIIRRNGAKTISLQTSLGDLKIIIIIIITKIDCVWMQTHKSPNEPSELVRPIHRD